MHGSVCLFSKYLLHLFEGENLEELDISSKSSSNNVFTNVKSLSTGWTGTCPPLQLFSSVKEDFNSELSSLATVLSSSHQQTMSAYNTINTLINNLYSVSTINVSRPSDSSILLIPNFESEFRDKNNKSLIGGEIYYGFNNKLKPYIDELNGNIQTNINYLLNSNSFKSSINDAYSNFAKFDTAVATASNIMNSKILDLKDYFLTLQFLLMFFTWGYLLFFVAIGVFYVIYLCKEYEVLYYFILVLINLLFVMILLEIFLSSFFGQVRLICHEIPRAINFIFTGTYMVSGNSGSYPAQFGRGDTNMTKMFTSCLNGNENLVSLFIKSSDLSSFYSLKNDIDTLYVKLSNELKASNLILNNYISIENSIFLNAITKLELTKDNLYIASEGFEKDDIYNILYTIRENLRSEDCSLNNEYFVVKESDCPSESIKLTTIQNKAGETHCYIIQNLSSAAVSYTGSSCNNTYIYNAINFIKQIDSLLDSRLEKIRKAQLYYSATFNNLTNEIYSISKILNDTYSIINNDLSKSLNISNCGSVRYDLIDFCDYIGDTTEYDARIVVIFSAFLGVFGFVLLYSFLVVFNGLSSSENDKDDYGYNYGKKKIKNINIKVNKSRLNRKTISDYDKDEDEDEDDENNYKKSFNNKKGKTPSKTGQKVEMSYMAQNNNDSDSS